MFYKAKQKHESKLDASSGHKQRSKMCLVYLEGKLEQDRYGVCI